MKVQPPEQPNFKWDCRISVLDKMDRSLYITMNFDGATEQLAREAAEAKVKGWGYAVVHMEVRKSEDQSPKEEPPKRIPWQGNKWDDPKPATPPPVEFPLAYFTKSGNKPTIKGGETV